MNMTFMKQLLFRINKFSTEVNYGRDVISYWAKEVSAAWPTKSEIRVLDVGCGSGEDMLNICRALPDRALKLYGIDFQQKYLKLATAKGIKVHILSIEHDQFPFDSNFFDLIIANQVFEHIKEIFWALSECSRVVKLRGHLILGVPNMAALHNRLLLLIGKQPACMHIVGPHVRGFTLSEFKEFIQTDSVFQVLECSGANLFPFPQALSRQILRYFPGLGITILFLCERKHSDGNILRAIGNGFDTKYFLGN